VTEQQLVANRAVVQGEVRRMLRRNPKTANTVVLLHAAAQWYEDPAFDFDTEDGPVRVTVVTCPTVLAVLAAISADREPDSYLVVLTPHESHDVGQSVLARAIEPTVWPINRWDLVRDAFGVHSVDPRLLRSDRRWVSEALLDAQPASGWRRLTGSVLTESTAMSELACVRLGMDSDGIDAAALLEWSAGTVAAARYEQLQQTERSHLTEWLTANVGPVATVVFGLAAQGKVGEAIPFGLAAAALYGTGSAEIARGRAEERYFGGNHPDESALTAFGEAAESLVARWTENGHAPQAAAMCERAERILSELGGMEAAVESTVLDAGLNARLVTLGEAIGSSLPDAEGALRRISEHRRRQDRAGEVQAAEAAVRVARWLALPMEEPAGTLAVAATRMLRAWAWADRALGVISRADTSRVPRLAAAYARLWADGKARRAELDEEFARKLAGWTRASGETTDLLLVENLLDRAARPIADKRAPVIVVLDGMSVAVGTELADELVAGGLWLEAGRQPDGREPVLATVPSVTSISRTSLLTGTLRAGGQSEETKGFLAFWGKRKSSLFHKADLVPEPGQALNAKVREAILDQDTVVGVVLNTIDDTLDKGKQGGPAHWVVSNVTYLRQIADEARRAGRPLVLTADHGHVLDLGRPPTAAPADSARYRTGVPGAGEITIRGPRVLVQGGEVVAAVDEAIHYLPHRAGYHGGAAPAEVVVPVITLLPSVSLLPDGWTAYDAVGHAPSWWDPPVSTAVRRPPPVPPSRKPKPVVPSGQPVLFDEAEIGTVEVGAAGTLGAKVAGSARMTDQRQFARRAPDNARVAALIDGLEQAGGRLTIVEVAQITGEPAVRMTGYIASVARLLNVDGYRVIWAADGGRTVVLDVRLLKEQFLGG
jgi:PglZ domain